MEYELKLLSFGKKSTLLTGKQHGPPQNEVSLTRNRQTILKLNFCLIYSLERMNAQVNGKQFNKMP